MAKRPSELIASHAGAIDLVLTDLNMPRMNGRELMERLTTNNPGVRVILTSGNDDLLDEHSAQSLEVEFSAETVYRARPG